jgi:hypothetical protein
MAVTYISWYLIYGNGFQGGDDGRCYRNMYKIPRGSPLNERGWYVKAIPQRAQVPVRV